MREMTGPPHFHAQRSTRYLKIEIQDEVNAGRIVKPPTYLVDEIDDKIHFSPTIRSITNNPTASHPPPTAI